MLPPELDLLEILSGQDEDLRNALRVFKPAHDRSALEQARHVVGIYVKSGLVQLIRVQGGGERVLKNWEVRAVLADDEAWTLDIGGESYYLLRLTERGYQSFAEDSQGFFRELFDRR